MLCKIVKEHPDYYLDEIVGEMINKFLYLHYGDL